MQYKPKYAGHMEWFYLCANKTKFKKKHKNSFFEVGKLDETLTIFLEWKIFIHFDQKSSSIFYHFLKFTTMKHWKTFKNCFMDKVKLFTFLFGHLRWKQRRLLTIEANHFFVLSPCRPFTNKPIHCRRPAYACLLQLTPLSKSLEKATF